MINVHPDFIGIIKEPIHKSKILDLVPRSVMVRNTYVTSIRKSGCVIEELEIKDGNT